MCFDVPPQAFFPLINTERKLRPWSFFTQEDRRPVVREVLKELLLIMVLIGLQPDGTMNRGRKRVKDLQEPIGFIDGESADLSGG